MAEDLSASEIQVSVVIAAFNAEKTIAATLGSVLSQQGPTFELILVNDGSTDQTLAVAEGVVAGVANVTVLNHSVNRGLTEALIAACSLARGRYIARIDAGDRYLPGRLKSQFQLLESEPSLGLVSCATQFTTENGENLYVVSQQPGELAAGLAQTELATISGPSHHGSTMFRRDLYEAVGGYRSAFKVAQDLDLWMRMFEQAEVRAMPEVLYQASLAPGSISVRKRNEQMHTAIHIVESARRRRSGQSELTFNGNSASLENADGDLSGARYHYFVACCLEQARDSRAPLYFRKAWKSSPFNIKYAARYLKSIAL